MSFEFNFNQQKMKLEVIHKGKILEELDFESMLKLEERMKAVKMSFEIQEKIQKNQYAQIIMDDVYDFETYGDKKIIGIDLEVRWMTRLDHTEDSVYLLFDDGTKDWVDYPDGIDRNFTDQQVKFGKASSVQITACLDDDVLDYIKKHPEFIVQFCGVDIPRDVLFGKREMFFEFESSSDT